MLVVDGTGRVLLLHGVDPGDPGAGSWWLTPGGGSEGAETPQETARRELWEETGLRPHQLDGPLAERTTAFHFDGVRYRQHEHFFVARLAELDVGIAPAAYTELETRAVLGWRWWSARELVATEELVHPGWLGAWLTAELHGRF